MQLASTLASTLTDLDEDNVIVFAHGGPARIQPTVPIGSRKLAQTKCLNAFHQFTPVPSDVIIVIIAITY